MTTKDMIRNWIKEGRKKEKDYMIVICDTFSYEHGPIFTTAEKFDEVYLKYYDKDEQFITEVYNLHINIERQVSMEKCKNFPPKSIYNPKYKV